MARRKIYQYQADGLEEERKISRSQKKRDSSALQETGEAIAALAPSQLVRLPLSPDLRAAIADFHGLCGREAKRRQLQYIGRLMREADNSAEIVEAYALLLKEN